MEYGYKAEYVYAQEDAAGCYLGSPGAHLSNFSSVHKMDIDVKWGLIVVDRIYPRRRPSLVGMSNGSRSAASGRSVGWNCASTRFGCRRRKG